MEQLLELLPAIEKTLCRNADKVLNHYFLHTTAEVKSDGSIVTEADFRMQKALSEALLQLLPNVKMLGEEMTVANQQMVIDSGDSYWCLDPVDGTNNFHHGVPLFAVSLALIKNKEVILGIIYDPLRHECFSAVKGGNLLINGNKAMPVIQPQDLKSSLASIDFKRLDPAKRQYIVTSMPFKSQRNIGSCALEWAWLAAGRIQLLLHGGEKIWDYAAGTLLLEEAGGVSCSTPGQAVFNGSLEPRPVIAASNESLFHHWSDYIAGIS